MEDREGVHLEKMGKGLFEEMAFEKRPEGREGMGSFLDCKQ